MVQITYSYTTATLLESTGIYNYAYNEIKVISAVVKSIRDPTISQDVTQIMRHFVSTQKMTDKVSMKSFTVDSSRLIDYTGRDIDPGHQKKMEIKLAHTDCILHMDDIDVCNNDTNVNNTMILEKTGDYYFSAYCLDVVKAVVKSVNNNCIAHDVTCALEKEIYMFQGMRFIKIDSSVFDLYTGCDIDPCSKKYLDITLSNDFHHPPKPCHPCTTTCTDPCTTTCPPKPCDTTCPNPCPPSNATTATMCNKYWSESEQKFVTSNRLLKLECLYKSTEFTIYKTTSDDTKFLSGEIMISNIDKTGQFSYKLTVTDTVHNILLKHNTTTNNYEGYVLKESKGGGFCTLTFH